MAEQPASEIEDASIPFYVRCADCEYHWPAAYYPMNVSKFAMIAMGARCPKCGAGGDKVLVANQTYGSLKSFNDQEIDHG